MATQKAISSNNVINNGGAALNSGTNFSTDAVITSRFSSSRTDLGVFGSSVVKNVNNEASLLTGNFAKLGPVVAKKTSVKLAGLPNTFLRSGAADPVRRRSIARMEAVRTTLWSTAFRADKFSFYTGKFQAGYPQVSVDDAMVVSGGVYQDHAADPTRSVPGQLVFKGGAKVPVTANYKPKNG